MLFTSILRKLKKVSEFIHIIEVYNCKRFCSGSHNLNYLHNIFTPTNTHKHTPSL